MNRCSIRVSVRLLIFRCPWCRLSGGHDLRDPRGALVNRFDLADFKVREPRSSDGFARRSRAGGAIMKRRELIRAGVLTGAAAALRPPLVLPQSAAPSSELTPAQRGVDATKDLAAAGWKPLFLDEHQNETLIVLSDLIIPATETPGAKEALVNRYIDLVLAADTHESQRAFLSSLSYLDGESMRRYKAAFRYLSREDQDDLLHAFAYPRGGSAWTGEAEAVDAGHAHFEQLKQRIGVAYYNSQIGTRELGWDGAFAHGTYQGCEHPEGNHK
jgi:gluconate 2-dehydrogenase gamma chain